MANVIVNLQVEINKVGLGKRVLTVIDKTGNFEAELNPGGWGTPNYERALLEKAVLSVGVNHAGKLYEKDVTIPIKEIEGGNPDEILLFEREWDDAIPPDGIYYATLTLSFAHDYYVSPSFYVFYHENISLAMNRIWTYVAFEKDAYVFRSAIEAINRMEVYHLGLKAMKENGQRKAFLVYCNKIIENLEAFRRDYKLSFNDLTIIKL